MNDRYVFGRKLGSDGDVYEAYDRHLSTTVALKLLNPVASTPQPWDEAKRLEQLRSTFVVAVINADVVTNSDIRFITTSLLPHGDLESDAAPLGLPVSLAVRYGHQIASGVDTIHAAGMVHRDIKPANALRDGDTVLVSDLAFCSFLDDHGEAPRNGSWCTLAPEAAPEDGVCSIATDVYSLAATVFYLLSGQYPVDHTLPRAQQQQLIASGAMRNISDVAPHVPRSVAMVVRRGMSTDPAARYSSAAEFGNALATSGSGRRDWQRVNHDGHAYCAEGAASGSRGAVGVCAEPAAAGKLTVRSFHLATGRAVAGEAPRTASSSRQAATVRAVIAALT